MPHKRKNAFRRNASRNAEDFYEQAPSAPNNGQNATKADDDTPKSFLRLVNRKSRKELIADGKIQVEKKTWLKIEPGEFLHDFKRRVDQEIPVRMGGMNLKEQRPKRRKGQPAADEEQSAEKKKRQRGKKKKRRSVSPDPYRHLGKTVPFNQPVEAPPTLSLPKRHPKSSLPNTLSAARKDLLESERQDIIAKYRQRMGRT